MIISILRRCVRTLEALARLIAAYEYHQRANRAVKQLRLHSDKELKDIGLTKDTIEAAAHRGCNWCNRGDQSA